jgi:hypothetical protein
MPREAISPTLRFEVLRRCNFACYYCGVPGSLGLRALHIEHVVPVAHGGGNDFPNLVAACWDCNAGKADGVPGDALIQAVRSDCCAYLESRGGRVLPCMHCGTPVQFFEDEELPEDGLTDCYICNQVFWAGVDFARGKRERPVER